MRSPLSPETIADMEATLRYLQRQFEIGLRIDAVNMIHVDATLARVDIEQSFARQSRINAECAASQIAAE